MSQPKKGAAPLAGQIAAAWDTKDLLEIDFRHSDPESLGNVLDQMPDTAEVPVIEFYYDTRGGGVGMVRCRHCKRHAANHNRGFVLRYADGSRVLFGRDCGAKQYGQVFVDQEKRFQAARKLQELLKRKAFIIRGRSTALELVEQIEGFCGWKTYCSTKATFRSAFWFIFTEIGIAVQRHGGRLTRVERVRDHEAEARQESKKKKAKPIYRDIEVPMGTLSGLSFFAPGPLPDKVLPDLCRRLKSALWSLDDKNRSHDLEVTFRGIEELVGAIEQLAVTVDELAIAAERSNIELLISWMAANHYGACRYENRRLYRHDPSGSVVAVQRQRNGSPGYETAVRAEVLLEVPQPFPMHIFADLRSNLRPPA